MKRRQNKYCQKNKKFKFLIFIGIINKKNCQKNNNSTKNVDKESEIMNKIKNENNLLIKKFFYIIMELCE